MKIFITTFILCGLSSFVHAEAKTGKDLIEADRLFREAVRIIKIEKGRVAYTTIIERNGQITSGLMMGTLAAYGRARKKLRKSVALNPYNPSAYQLLALTYWDDEYDLVEAEKLYKKAIEVDQEFHEAYAGLAIIAALRGDRVSAVQRLAKFPDAQPELAHETLRRTKQIIEDYVEGDEKKAPKEKYRFLPAAFPWLLDFPIAPAWDKP